MSETKIPSCIDLDPNGLIPVQGIGLAISDNKEGALLSLSDNKGQSFPLAFTRQALVDLFLAVSSASYAVSKPDAEGKPTSPAIVNAANLPEGAKIPFGIQYNPTGEVLRLTVGGVSIDMSFTKDAAKQLAASLQTSGEAKG